MHVFDRLTCFLVMCDHRTMGTHNSSVVKFLRSSSCFLYFLFYLFDNGNSYWDEVIPHCGLISIFLTISDAEHFPLCLLAICMSSLEIAK